MRSYKHILFDLDHTLWDFDRCSCETLTELFETYRLNERTGIQCDDFVATFREVNRELWAKYGRREISQHELRTSRFRIILHQLGVDGDCIPPDFADAYMRMCPQKPHLLPYAREVLAYLKNRYGLHIITNGFADVQSIKLASANIAGYFTEVITSERAGCHKPDRQIFVYTLNQINALPGHCLMIGDGLDTDVLGARNAAIDHVFYNRERVVHTENPTHEINCLSELMELL